MFFFMFSRYRLLILISKNSADDTWAWFYLEWLESKVLQVINKKVASVVEGVS